MTIVANDRVNYLLPILVTAGDVVYLVFVLNTKVSNYFTRSLAISMVSAYCTVGYVRKPFSISIRKSKVIICISPF